MVDASALVAASGSGRALEQLAAFAPVAPPLLWSEARSVVHELLWRGTLDAADAESMRSRVESCPVRRIDDPRLGKEAWLLAERLGWAKTYDAEYLALARLLSCRLLTVDARLRRGAARLELVVGPDELGLGE